MKIKINERSFFYFLVIATPFVDLFNIFYYILGNSNSFSVGKIIRIFFLFIMIIFIAKYNRNLIIYSMGLFFILLFRNLLYFALYSADILKNLSCDLRYFYVLSFGFAIFTALKKKRISQADLYFMIKIVVSLVAVISLISSISGFGIEYGGTKRVFIEVNALTVILVIGTGFYIYEILFKKINILTVIMTLVMILATISQATKTGLIGVVVCGVFMYFYMGFVRKKLLKQFLLFWVILSGFILLYKYYMQGNGMAILARWKYFYNDMDLFSFLLSGRNDMLVITYELWVKHPITVVLGMGFSYAEKLIYSVNPKQSYVGSEMDIFDLFFYYGIIIGTIIMIPIIKNLFACIFNLLKNNEKSYYNFLYIIMFLISFLGGHVLNSPLAGIVFCLLMLLTYGNNSRIYW